MTTFALEASGLCKNFGALRVADNIDLHLTGRCAARADRAERRGQNDVRSVTLRRSTTR